MSARIPTTVVATSAIPEASSISLGTYRRPNGEDMPRSLDVSIVGADGRGHTARLTRSQVRQLVAALKAVDSTWWGEKRRGRTTP